MPNYYVPTGYFINWSREAVTRLNTATIADVKRWNGVDHLIKPTDEDTRAAVIRSPNTYFERAITFSRTGIYAPTYRIGSGSVYDTEGSSIFSNQFSPELALAITASALSRYLLKCIIDHTVHAQVDDIKELLLADPNDNLKRELETLVSQVIEHQRANPRYPYHLHEQKKIDALIYQLYGLDKDDIREVELWYCRRYPLLAKAQGVTAEVQTKYADYLAHAAFVMSRPASYWNSHPILRLIAQGESQRLEFKQTLEADAITGLANPGVLQSTLKTIAAFANTDGGTLLIGVHDRGDITGLTPDYALFRNNQGNADTYEQKLRSLFHTRFTPNPYGNISIEIHTLPVGQLCEITVRPVDAAEVVHLDTRDVYIRDGNGSRKLEGPALTRWLVKRGQQRGPG